MTQTLDISLLAYPTLTEAARLLGRERVDAVASG